MWERKVTSFRSIKKKSYKYLERDIWGNAAHLHAFTKLFERAITLRIHHKKRIKEEENKNERSSTSRVSFSFFCTRAHAHETERVLARKGERARFWFFQKSRHLNSNLGDDLDDGAR